MEVCGVIKLSNKYSSLSGFSIGKEEGNDLFYKLQILMKNEEKSDRKDIIKI